MMAPFTPVNASQTNATISVRTLRFMPVVDIFLIVSGKQLAGSVKLAGSSI
jgi:hypothetical protein